MNRLIIKFISILILCTACEANRNTKILQKIAPPFENLELEADTKSIDPTIDQLIRFSNGISLEIPKNAFQDSLGQIVTDSVTIAINNYESASEILASGIPMTYQDGDETRDFESAGMFKVLGKSNGQEVSIAEGKELIINYPSSRYGDFDFFQFEEHKKDSVVKGRWKQLTAETETEPCVLDSMETFRAIFDTVKYSNLKPLMTIDWYLSTDFQNTNEEEYKWIKEEAWTSLDFSQPKYGFGETIFSDEVNFDRYLSGGAIIVSEDKSRIITSKMPITKIWNREGKLIKTINKVRTDYYPVKLLNDRYLLIKREDGDAIFDLDGKLIGTHPKTRNLKLASSKDIVVYDRWGTTDPTVYIAKMTGEVIKEIKLWEHNPNFWYERQIYEQFLLTEQDELFTNSLDGVQWFDLQGNRLKHYDGEFHDIDVLKEDMLLLESLEGDELVAWDYKKGTKTKSRLGNIDLANKTINNTVHSSTIEVIPNSNYVIVHEAATQDSKLWNYESNKLIELDFYLSKEKKMSGQLLVGYDYDRDIYHLYDLLTNQDVITISNIAPGFYTDESIEDYYYGECSSDEKYILIKQSNHALYYKRDGSLIRDFKQYDSLISNVGFLEDNTVFTISRDGLYRTWNNTGQLLSSTQVSNKPFDYIWSHLGVITTWNSIFENRDQYSSKGSLEYSFRRSVRDILLDSTQVLYFNKDTKKASLKSLFELPECTYQLTLRNNQKELITYVSIDESDKQKIDKYYEFKAQQTKEEQTRKQNEQKLMRRFSINQFGLYNWDKLISDEGTIRFAANFEFDVPVDYNNITVYLVTEFNGQAVISFNKTSWSNFWINPQRKSQLVAVLPNNKVALLSDQKIKSMDFSSIKEGETFTFNMKTIETPITDLSDLDKLLY